MANGIIPVPKHAVGMRSISNHNTGFAHQRGHISDHAAAAETRTTARTALYRQ